MRIGIDVRCLAEGKRTGVEEYTLALLKEFFLHDRENSYVLFFNAWKQSVPDFSWATHYPNVELKAFRFPNKLLNLTLWYLGWPKLDVLVGGTDVFFLPNLNFASFSLKTKVILTAHDLSFEMFPEMFSLKQRLWHYLLNFRRLTKRADKIIAVSQSTKDDLVSRYGLPEKKVTVIHSGVGEELAVMSRNDPRLLAVKEKYHLPYKFILYLGTIEPRKNILALIQSFETLLRENHPAAEKYMLVIAGAKGWKYQAILDAIEASPFRERILLPGFIEDADKAALYNLASVFVYPSFYEGFGFPVLEAMSCGVPVITSHSSSLPEVVGEAGVMIDPYQPEELLRALEGLISDPALGAALIDLGKKRAKAFTWKEAATQTLNLLKNPSP